MRERRREAALAKLPKVQGGSGQVYLSQETARLLDSAEQRPPRRPAIGFVTAEYLLLALTLAAGTESARILKDAGVTAQGLNKAIAGLQPGAHRRQRHGREQLMTRSRNMPAI